MLLVGDETKMIGPERALRGRDQRMPVPDAHEVLGNPLIPPFPDGFENAVFGMGCFWGAERMFWQAPGVWTTAVGYAGGYTPNPTYEEVCSGSTGHTEAVLVVFDPRKTSYEEMLRIFWEGHDPTHGMRQGNDVGTQYRSAVYHSSPEQRAPAEPSRDAYATTPAPPGDGEIPPSTAQAGPDNFLSRCCRGGFGIAVVYICLLLIPIGLGALIIPPVVTQVEHFAQNAPHYAQDARDYIEKNKTLKGLQDKYDIAGQIQ